MKNASRWLERIAAGRIETLGPEELPDLLAAGRCIRDVDTRLAGVLRVLEVGGVLLVQEQTTRGQILVRRIASVEAADALIASRLEIYERMWDGCGCKVDYFTDTTPG